MDIKNNINYFPNRIVCLTEEPTEMIYLIGEQARIVGISTYTVRPLEAKQEKPQVSAFLHAKIDKIIKLKPDLVIGYSDIQANIAKELIAAGITVWISNHRSIHEIYKMLIQLGSMLGRYEESYNLVTKWKQNIDDVSAKMARYPIKPRVYFEEWYDPLISGIQWVGELIELAGGINIFADQSKESLAKNRIISDSEDVVKKNPDIIIVSWCGKKFDKKKLISRTNWVQINAIENNEIYEIDSSLILQPGPACLTDGFHALNQIILNWQVKRNNTQID